MDHGLLVIEDDQMFVRVGDSHANLMPMGPHGLRHRMATGVEHDADVA